MERVRKKKGGGWGGGRRRKEKGKKTGRRETYSRHKEPIRCINYFPLRNIKCLTDLGGYGVGNQAVKEGRGGQAERPIQRTRPLALGPLGLAPDSCCWRGPRSPRRSWSNGRSRVFPISSGWHSVFTVTAEDVQSWQLVSWSFEPI